MFRQNEAIRVEDDPELRVRPLSGPAVTDPPTAQAFERHYRVAELAALWKIGRETIRQLVKDEPGVAKVRLGRKRANAIYSVPESVARRIHTRLLIDG